MDDAKVIQYCCGLIFPDAVEALQSVKKKILDAAVVVENDERDIVEYLPPQSLSSTKLISVLSRDQWNWGSNT
jgi:hypothetical protein